jgi:hypothetical protein
MAGGRREGRLSYVVLSQAKGGSGAVVFEVRVGRKLARRSGMLSLGGDKNVKSSRGKQHNELF